MVNSVSVIEQQLAAVHDAATVARPVMHVKSHLDADVFAPYLACPSALITCALRAPLGPQTAVDFAQIDPSRLSADGLLRRMQVADLVSSWAQAQAARALADYVGPELNDLDADRHHRLEVRIARKCSDDAAGRDIFAARRLAADARLVRDAWERGQLNSRHVFIAMERTALAEPELSQAVFEELGDRLTTVTSSRLGAVITKTMCRLDPKGQARRSRVARRHNVGVSFRSLPDGLGQVIATHRIEDARSLMDLIDTRADQLLEHRRGCEPCADALPDEIGPARSAAHLSLTLDSPAAERPIATHQPALSQTSGNSSNTARLPRKSKNTRRGARKGRGELQVVIDLNTLLGLADNPGLAGGHPIPAEIARELAAECGSLRRIITDPVSGHLLDYGTRTYLPDKLKKFIAARDGTCRSPGCGQPAARSQLDHIEPFPAGPSNTDNTHSLCKRDHDSKTKGDFRVLEHDSSGRARWRTRHGQHGVTEPRAYLTDPHLTDPHSPDIAVPPEPYPF
jgi:HNH endonuclease